MSKYVLNDYAILVFLEFCYQRLVYAQVEPFPVLIMKDLSPDGFSAPRQPPVDLDDSKLIIKRLAQFHAASFYLSESVGCKYRLHRHLISFHIQQSEYDFTSYNYTIFQTSSVVEAFYGDTLKLFREVVETG